MSTEVLPIVVETSKEIRVLHFGDGKQCAKCKTSLIAMRRYFTTDRVTYEYIAKFSTKLRSRRGDVAVYIACTQ